MEQYFFFFTLAITCFLGYITAELFRGKKREWAWLMIFHTAANLFSTISLFVKFNL